MRFHPLYVRYVDCPVGSGSLWYTCAASNYEGCCMVDACAYDDGCPEAESITVTATSTTTARTTARITLTTSTAAAATTLTTSATSAPATPTTSATSASAAPTTAAATTTSAQLTTTTGTVTSAAGPNQVSVYTSVLTQTTAASATAAPAATSAKASLSGGAIGGIVAGGVIGFLLIAGLVLFRMHRRNKAIKAAASGSASGSDGHTASDEPSSAGYPTPAMSPSTLVGTPMAEKGMFKSPTPMSTTSAAGTPLMGDGPLYGQTGPAEMSGAPSMRLFGELDGNGLDPALAAAARQRLGAISELDSTASGRAELDTPTATPTATPAATPQIGSVSPDPSHASGSQGGRSTFVSSWRSSSMTANTLSELGEKSPTRSQMVSPTLGDTPSPLGAQTTGEFVPLAFDPASPGAKPRATDTADPTDPLMPLPLQIRPQAASEPQPSTDPGQGVARSPSVAEQTPRANLDLSETEREKGTTVASWGEYKG